MVSRARLNPIIVLNAPTDEALFKLLSDELNARLAPVSDDLGALHSELLKLPRGLRAMGATHPLDVSMALDDLGWHFRNWPSKPLADETLIGLMELGAVEEAKIFEAALSCAIRHWEFIGSESFFDAYLGSPLEAELERYTRVCGTYVRPAETC